MALVIVEPGFAGDSAEAAEEAIRAHVRTYVDKGVISKFAIPDRVDDRQGTAADFGRQGRQGRAARKEPAGRSGLAIKDKSKKTRAGNKGVRVMSETTKKANVKRLFWEQVALNFIVVAVLIACGALLTFNVMGEEYSQWTVVGFFATVFFAFIVFLPAGTLFAARAEFAKDKIQIEDDEKTGAVAPIANPLLETAPLGVALAAAGTAIVYCARLRHGMDAVAAGRDARLSSSSCPMRSS